MKAVTVTKKTKPKPKARKSVKKTTTRTPQNRFPDTSAPFPPFYIPGETEEQRVKRLAARKAKTLKIFQMIYDSHHAK